MVALGGCSTANQMMGRNQQTWTMTTDPAVPSAVGRVQVSTGNKGTNRDLRVEASHLAKADSKFDGATTYVVWLKPQQGQPVNIGVLTPDKNENAQLATSTPYTTFEIAVTAESTAQPTTPSSHEVMNTMVHVAT
jgi:hypothetical protein